MAAEPKTRTSTKAGLAGAIAVVIIWTGNYFVPEFMAAQPDEAKVALTVIIMTIVARFSKTPSRPGKLL